MIEISTNEKSLKTFERDVQALIIETVEEILEEKKLEEKITVRVPKLKIPEIGPNLPSLLIKR